MDQDGGAKLPPTKRPEARKVGVMGQTMTSLTPQKSTLGIVAEEYAQTASDVKTSEITRDRRNPLFPNGFQPTAIRNLFSEKSADAPSNTFPGVTAAEQLEALDRVESRRLVETGIQAAEQCKTLWISSTNCFLCGFNLKDPRIPFKNQYAFGYPQCEHLLPAAAALLVFGIVESKEEANQSPGNYRLNYAYAHSGCNREKGSRLFVSMNPSDYVDGKSPIFRDNIRKYLEDLYAFNPTIQSAVISQGGAGSKDAWIATQLEHITAIYSPLSAELGRLDKIGMLIGVAKYFENIDYLYAKLIRGTVRNKQEYYDARVTAVGSMLTLGRGRKTFRRKHNGVSKRSNKHTYRKSPRSHRKGRTSDRGRVKTGTRKDA